MNTVNTAAAPTQVADAPESSTAVAAPPPKPVSPIPPTVGRTVLFSPDDGPAIAAVISEVPPKGPLGLAVLPRSHTAEYDPDGKPGTWRWMEYQKGQAAKNDDIAGALTKRVAALEVALASSQAEVAKLAAAVGALLLIKPDPVPADVAGNGTSAIEQKKTAVTEQKPAAAVGALLLIKPDPVPADVAGNGTSAIEQKKTAVTEQKPAAAVGALLLIKPDPVPADVAGNGTSAIEQKKTAVTEQKPA